MKIIACDTETTGVDLFHGAKPFLVTVCRDDDSLLTAEWHVDPFTREPMVVEEERALVQAAIDDADVVLFHNSKFDVPMLAAIDIVVPWDKARCTFTADHLLGSNLPHNLTDVVMRCLGHDIGPLEGAVKKIVTDARKIAKDMFPDWKLAKEGDPDMPSVKGSSGRDEDKPWKNDMWLPRIMRQFDPDGKFTDPSWDDACRQYADGDSVVTRPLGMWQEGELKRQGLWEIYLHRNQLPMIAAQMQASGVTVIDQQHGDMVREYTASCAAAETSLVQMAKQMGHDLELAKGASLNDNMREFIYGRTRLECPRCGASTRWKGWAAPVPDGGEQPCPKCFKKGVGIMCDVSHDPCLDLPPLPGKKGTISLDVDVMEQYRQTLDPGPALDFVSTLKAKRQKETALTSLHTYQRFWLATGRPGYHRIHSNLNPCATNHLRWASNSPNLQNVSKKEAECEACDGEGCDACGGTGLTMRSIRHCFGPMHGREWWSMDYISVENRIPPYECLLMFGKGDAGMLEVFEKPDEPPYWGSLYLLTASVLYPDQFWADTTKGAFRKHYPQLYKQTKFFVLAKQYGSGAKKGDILSRVRGSFGLVDSEFPMLTKLQAHWLQFARKHGYVETLPDRSVNPKRGYPILASRTEDGNVLSTTPFNYHTSGTACWIKNRALERCSAQIKQWNLDGWSGFMALEIHDEIVFDCPRGTGAEPWKTNLPRMRKLKSLMEAGGQDVGIPTPASMEYHNRTWAEGMAL